MKSIYCIADKKHRSFNDNTPLRKIVLNKAFRKAVREHMENEDRLRNEDFPRPSCPVRDDMDFIPIKF
jgi:hypothetical protein